MEDRDPIKINPNLADLETLQQLPGVGPTFAQLIQDSRPYATIEDLQKVSGVDPVVVERWKDLLYFPLPGEPSEEPDIPPSGPIQAVDPVLEAEMEPDQPESIVPEPLADQSQPESFVYAAPASQEPAQETVPAAAEDHPVEPPEPVFETAAGPSVELQEEQNYPPPAPAITEAAAAETNTPPAPPPPTGWISLSQAVWGMVITGFVTLILAVALSLGILAGMNAGLLQFATPAQVAALSTQAKGLDTRASALEQDTQGLRTRLDNLEALGSRIGAVENTASDLQAQMKTVATQVATLNNDVSGLQSQVDAVTKLGQQFTKFIEGLQSLLTGLLPLSGGN